ncbi:CHAT domain-containing protein [Rhodococcus daqingensis]|uniref:CHAT domain-containing protein n=1 Tax=Rhodococcus daqingensis TaxID=2479363 RepID=A0ABW2S057_9NOCA
MSDKIAAAEFGLDLTPGPGSGEYTVKVVRGASGGRPHSTFRLDVDALADLSRSLETTVLASAARARRRVVPELERPLREVGSQLFQALFAGPIDTAYRSSLAVAGERGEKLRLVLSITAPELAVMPWEALYDRELETYVCLKDDVVRHIDAPYTPDPLPVRPPLRILAIVASPRGLPELNVDAERQHLERALAGPISAGQARLDWETQASWWRVHERLLQEPWHVLHFIGHGDYDYERGEGRIALVRDDGRADWVDATKLADLLGEAEPTPRVVVLNSCASGQSGSNDLFSGTAATLVRRGISAVAAMQFSVSDTAAVAFPRGFYTALVSGRRVDEAVRSGRIDIRGIGDGTLEWVTPILHVRGDATELFQLVGEPEPVRYSVTRADERQDLLGDSQWADALGAYYAKRWPEAVEHFEALQARYPDEARVETRLQQARRQRDIQDWSANADASAQEGDWDTVVSALEHLTALDPKHPDAASRLEHARIAQRCRSLVDEMTALHQARQWDAVVAAAQELAGLDPDNPDPDGIVSDAQAQIRDAQLADRYAQALNHLDEENWRQAAELFAVVEQDQLGYRDASTLRATAEQQLDLADKYRRATESQTSGEWTTAATLFGEIVAMDAQYRDAATRRDQCKATSPADIAPTAPPGAPTLSDKHRTAPRIAAPPTKFQPLFARLSRRVKIAVTAGLVATIAIIAAVITLAPQTSQTPQTSPTTELPFSGRPTWVAVDSAGAVYVTDVGTNRVLKLAPGATSATELAFSGLGHPAGVAVDSAGAVYVTDNGSGTKRVLKLAPGATSATELAFSGLELPAGVAVDSAGAVYVADFGTSRVLKLAPGATSATELAFSGLKLPGGVAVDSAGAVYVTDIVTNRVLKLAPGATSATELAFSGLDNPGGVAVDSAGAVYVADFGTKRVLKLAPRATSATELAFSGLEVPGGVAVDSAGAVYVTNNGTNRVLKLAAG